jgi:hypothetical protein
MMASRMDREVIGANDVPLFRRHDIRLHWAQSSVLDLMTGGHDKLYLVASRLYDGIGRAVTDFVTRGAHPGMGLPAASSGRNT